MRVDLFAFPMGDHIEPLILNDWKMALSDRKQKDLLSKLSNQNCEIAILFNMVKRSNNYGFEDDLTPHSFQGKGCK